MRKLDSFLTIPRFFADGDSIEKLEAKIRGVTNLLVGGRAMFHDR